MEISDRVTVLRAGKVIGTVNTRDTTPSELALMMIGRKLDMHLDRVQHDEKIVVLEVKNLKMKSLSGALSVDDLSLKVHRGEIYGIAGVDGNGQSELIKGHSGTASAHQRADYSPRRDASAQMRSMRCSES